MGLYGLPVHHYHVYPRGIFRDIILIQRSENETCQRSFHRIPVNNLELTEAHIIDCSQCLDMERTKYERKYIERTRQG